MIALLFFGNDAFQRDCADIFGVTQGTVSKIVKKIAPVIASLREQYIKFPSNEALAKVQHQFYKLSGIPGECNLHCLISGTA